MGPLPMLSMKCPCMRTGVFLSTLSPLVRLGSVVWVQTRLCEAPMMTLQPPRRPLHSGTVTLLLFATGTVGPKQETKQMNGSFGCLCKCLR